MKTLKPRLLELPQRLKVLKPGSWRDGKTTDERGYTYRWVKASKAFLAAHPLCTCPDCDDGRKRVTVATVVDHEPPHRGDMQKFWDRRTWRAMAKPCHDLKTQRELREEANG